MITVARLLLFHAWQSPLGGGGGGGGGNHQLNKNSHAVYLTTCALPEMESPVVAEL